MRILLPSLRVAAGLAGMAGAGLAQERAGEADIGFQQYSLTNGSQRVANAFGLTLGFREFIPSVGIVSISLAPGASQGRFWTGDTFAELKRFPWMGQYWTFRGGDFRLPGRIAEVRFNNLYLPETSGRGGWAEATHGGRTFGFFYGAETLQAGVRVPLRLPMPQTMAGGYFRQTVGERLLVGVRFLSLSTGLEKLRNTPSLPVQNNPIRRARTATVEALYTIAGPLKWYGEAAISQASREELGSGGRGGPISATMGPLLETSRFTLRANYVYQTDSYRPLLGYFLGDRRGPYGEVSAKPFSWLNVNGSVSSYTNNVARDPRMPTFRSMAESAGVSVQLPGRFSVSGQWSAMKLDARKSGADPWEETAVTQRQVALSRSMGRHNLRLAAREFQQRSRVGPQRQRTAEAGDSFQYRWFSFGAEVRAQQSIADRSKMSVFVRGNGQITVKRLSAFANIESGNDLANRTLFATSATNTTVLGGTVRLGRDWNFSAEAYRSKLITELNRQNVFVLQGQGVHIPSVLSAMNQWSLYLRVSKHLRWGDPLPAGVAGLDGYASISQQTQLKGFVEGYVRAGENEGVAGIPVALDGGTRVLTDAAGRFRFDNVAEGARKVSIALNELPSDYDPGRNIASTVLVKPGRPSRADFDVVVAGYAVQGTVKGPKDVSLATIMLKLLPTGRYTTPDNSGRFAFYNVREGRYEVALAEETLPPHAALTTAARVPVTVANGNRNTPPVEFGFEIRVPAKPVRRVNVATRRAEAPPAAAPKPSVTTAKTPANPPKAEPRRTVEAALPAAAVLPPAKPALSGAEAMDLHAQGRQLIKSGEFKRAVAVLTEAIRAKSEFPLAYNARCYAHVRLSKYKEAVNDCTEAIRQSPGYINAYQNRAAANRALRNSDGAKSDARMAKAFR